MIIVCVEVLWPSQTNGLCRAWSVYLTTLMGRLSALLTSIVHIVSPETDNCPSWITTSWSPVGHSVINKAKVPLHFFTAVGIKTLNVVWYNFALCFGVKRQTLSTNLACIILWSISSMEFPWAILIVPSIPLLFLRIFSHWKYIKNIHLQLL